jgi:iron complex outermembrane receptor protein
MHVPSFKPRKASTLAVGIATAVMCIGTVNAQEAPGVESIQVTGSRIARDGYDMPTPVSVLGDDDINAEAPASIAEFAMTLPSIQGSTTATTNSGSLSSGQSGISSLNLRGLGTGRTLVLFDGQRSVASSAVGLVDTNTFPQALVERIEVVSGGASSAYGSDAIAGVVNFIMDKDYTGVKAAVEYGEVTEYGAANQRMEFTMGNSFADGQGHFLFSTEYYQQDGIRDTDADWQLKGYNGIVNPDRGTAGQPFYITTFDSGISGYTPGGLIVSGPLKGTYFGEGGAVDQLNYGIESGIWQIGGDWRYAQSSILGTNSLQASSGRKSAFGRVSWELSPEITVFAQGSFAGYEGDSDYIRPTDRNRTIQIDNAFLPQSVRDQMIAEGITSFRMSSARQDIPLAGANNTRGTTRWVVGAEGMFDFAGRGFTWDTYYQLGQTETDEHQNPTWSFANLAAASDAVFDANGEIVCRSGVAGCVPLNSFGVGVASEEALDYVLGRPRREQFFDQEVFAFNLQTEIDGFAGPIGLATGVEWRQDEIDAFVDPKYNSGWKYGNYKETRGKQSVKEIYGEIVMPLMDGLEFNGAARYTDYSNSGGVNTWKAGLTYMPIDDITFRVTQSRDIRAPNLSELFDAGTARSNSVDIGGASTPFIQNLQGTPTVGPEEADAFGFGVVLQPRFLPGFALSLDYYDIEVDGVIGFLNAQQVADGCFLFNNPSLCSQLRYDAGGTLQFIDLKYDNLTGLISEGVDIESSYSFAMADFFGDVPGEVSLRWMSTNYMSNATDNGVDIRERAGENTGNTPDWVHRATVSYNLDDFSFRLTARGHSDGVIDNRLIECASNCPVTQPANRTINDNSIDGNWFFDAYASYALAFGGGQGEVFISVKNLLDEDPVLVAYPFNVNSENRPGYQPANRALNDVLGRNLRMGMRFEF